MSGQEFLCAKCSKINITCCQHRDIYVTLGDIRRISGFSGRIGFYEFRRSTDPGYMDQEDDPVWARHVISADGLRRVLKQDHRQDCIFLGNCGCVLSMMVRPLVCRLFPYEYNEKGIYPEPAQDCPAHLLETGLSLMDALGMNIETAKIWHQTLYTEILEEANKDENRHDIRSAV